MEVCVTLTDGESVQTREKGVEQSNDIIDTVTRFHRVEVVECE